MAIHTTPWARRGAIWVRETDSPSLLTAQAPSAYLADFDYSVNPLGGCPFACRYCYVPSVRAVTLRRERLPDGQAFRSVPAWGSWVEVRVRSPDVLRRALASGKLAGKRLFMSPVSDVYWPGERQYRLTRRLLEAFVECPIFDWLLISTRSRLVCDDLDLLRRLGPKVEVGISIPTDRDDVIALFERRNPSLAQRFAAARDLVAAGIPTRIHVAPLQPHTPDFPARLAGAAHWVWVDHHGHPSVGFGALYRTHDWRPSRPEDAEAFAEQLRRHLPPTRARVGRPHFADRWGQISAR